MMRGGYGTGKLQLPRVLHVSIARYLRALPKARERLTFLVSIHEEGTGVTWQQNVSVPKSVEEDLLEATRDLHLWSLQKALTPERARARVRELGTQLYDTFFGRGGNERLRSVTPTSYLLDVDETILNLPWELLAANGQVLAQETPFGRLITTRVAPRRGRDPLAEDATVRILVVANPGGDLGVAETTLRVGGRRLVSTRSQANGLAAAFLSAGVEAYAGFFWPVSDVGAGMFANEFYRGLFERENVGLAFLAARKRVVRELSDVGDLAGYGAVLFGDAASAHRRDLATAR